jgi:hypothetical protein
MTTRPHGSLYDYKTGERLGPATAAQLAESITAAKQDGGAGVISVDGRSCFVIGEGPSSSEALPWGDE